MIYMNIQLFAGEDKTEKPTPKRRQKAREEGQVVQSRELSSAILLLCILFILKYSADYIFTGFKEVVSSSFGYFTKSDEIFQINGIGQFMLNTFKSILLLVAPVFIGCFLVSLVVSYLQVGFLFTTKTLMPKLDRLNPLQGFKRMFSARSLVELLKSFAKLILLGYIGYSYISSQAGVITNLYSMSLEQIFLYISKTVFNVIIRMCIALVAIGIADYIFQKFQHEKGLKMTKHEIKEEMKQSEGNPEIKAKIKQKQRQLALRRMMQDVPKADVVITNPTHFAVAVKYDSEQYAAPFILAKGQDYLAQRIKQIAKDNNVEIVENKALARGLYANCEIGELVPPELYQAVAEVLAYVYNLKNK